MSDEFGTGFGGQLIQKELVRVGAHQAVCCQVHSLGIQSYMGKLDLNPTGVFVFELDEKITQGPQAGKPFVMSEKLSQYMGSAKKHSKLRQFLQAWIGAKAQITDELAAKMNIKRWERRSCTLIIGNIPHKDAPNILVSKILGIGPPDPNAPRVPITYTEVPKWIVDAKEEARKMAAMRGFDPQDQRPDRMAAAVPPGAVPASGGQPAQAPAARVTLPAEDDLPF
jgi:hypothetical protein